MTPDQLAAPATEDSFDGITGDQIFAWAVDYLPRPNASAFADWLDEDLNNWADPANGTVADVLAAAYEQWTDQPLPTE